MEFYKSKRTGKVALRPRFITALKPKKTGEVLFVADACTGKLDIYTGLEAR